MDRYEEYFYSQVGGGYGNGGGIGRVYVGSPYQRGHGGIGSFLAGVFRRVLPLLTRGAKAVGKEALRTGVNIVSDVARNTPIKESFRNRVRESGENLKRKAEEKLDKLMEGSGYKMARHGATLQLPASFGGVSKKKRRRKNPTSRKKKPASKKKKKVVRKVNKKKKEENAAI